MADRPDRVVFVLPTLVGGGAEAVVRTVADGLARDGLDVGIVALLDPPDTSHRTPAGVDVKALGAPRVRAALRPVLRHLRRARPRAVMSTLKHVSIGLGLLARWMPPDTLHVARVANTYSKELESTPRAGYQRGLIRLSHGAIHRFVCVSDGVKADLVDGFGVPRRRCRVIPNPVDVDRFVEQAAQPPPELHAGIGSARVRFLAVGRLEPQKDHESLLRAFATVRQRVDAALLIVGEGSLRTRLERLADDLGVARHVQFLGFVENPYPLFRMSDALVLPSRFEGLPNVLLEALALGMPCVATDCPHGPADILREPGLGVLVPVGDVERLALAMADATTANGDRDARVRHVRRHYSPSSAIHAYRDALLDPAGGGV